LIDFKRVRHAAQPSKDLRTRASSEAQPVRPQTATIGPRNDLTGILVCRRSAGFTDTFGCHPAINDTPEPSGAHPLCKLCLESSGSPDRARIPPPSLFGSSPERLQDAHRVPPGTHRNLRVPPNASGRSPALHPSRTGLSRPNRTTRSSTDNLGCPPGRLRSPTRCVICHERPRMLTGTSGFHPSPFGDSKPVRPNSPFNGDSIVSL
jgi:hypothetical protein